MIKRKYTNRKFNILGKTFGMLRVEAYSHCNGAPHGHYWFCSCSCGSFRLRPYNKHDLMSGRITNCGCVRKVSLEKRRKPNNHALWVKIYQNVMWGAKKRKYNFELTFDQVKKLCTKPCFYCGRENVNRRTSKWSEIRFNGIDRIDNDLGYTLENSVTACGPCNKLKSDMSQEEFINLIKLISTNLKLTLQTSSNS